MPIVTIEEIQRRARAAFAAGTPLADCPLPWHSAAYETFAAEYALLEAAKALVIAARQEQPA
ncbi:MAG: hypothetical protein V4508_02380 [Pseudomonadota bacterium]